jgi:hypothetical protein
MARAGEGETVELRLEAESPCRPVRRRPDEGERDRADEADLAPEDLGRGNGDEGSGGRKSEVVTGGVPETVACSNGAEASSRLWKRTFRTENPAEVASGHQPIPWPCRRCPPNCTRRSNSRPRSGGMVRLRGG